MKITVVYAKRAGATVRNLIIWAIILGAVGYGGTKWYLHHRVGEGVDMAVLMMSPWAQIEYDGISSTMTGELTIDGVSAYVTGFADEFYIGQIGIDTPSFLSLMDLGDVSNGMRAAPDIPDYFGFIANDIRVPVDADYFKKLYSAMLAATGATDADDPAAKCAGKYGFSPEALAGLGYDEQILSLSMIFRQREGAYALEMNVDLEDMWQMDAVMTLAGDMTNEILKGTSYRPRLSDIHVEYKDRSLKERVEKYCDRLGLSPEQIFEAQMAAFRYKGESNGIVFDEYMLEPYEEFLNGKSTLVVTAKPSEPISMNHIDLYKPEDVPALLNLEASVR